MQTRAEAIACCLQLPDVYEDYPFTDKNWTVMRHRQNKKAYAWIFEPCFFISYEGSIKKFRISVGLLIKSWYTVYTLILRRPKVCLKK